MTKFLAVCAVPLTLVGVTRGDALQVIIFGTLAMWMLFDLYPPTGGKK